ncbi:MAG TPA: HD domain-containing phosphohydrolase, partial [Vicinamibacterales bacterium]|nr:HD domain-containing phosphohydrolase [Vicinamibacterales bacterium]
MAVLKEFCFRPAVDGPNRPVICVSPAQSKVIGRSADADAVVDEPSLSRQHARLSMAPDGAVTVEDLGSTNGVFVNGTQRRVATLVPGDVVRLGAVEFKTDTGRSRTEFPDGSMVRRRQADRAVVDRAALEALLSTSREIMAFGDLQGLLDRVLDRLQAILTPDRSAILLIDPATGELVPRSVRPAGAYQNVSEFASSTAVHESLSSREVLVVEDAKADERLRNAASVMQAGVRSAISVPLLGRSGPIGALYADRTALRGSFEGQQIDYAAAFAAHAAAALETAQLYDDREQHFRLTLEALAKAIDARDKYTAGHSERVTRYTLVLATAMKLPDADLDVLRRAGMLHDIGKVGVPDHVLLKPAALDAAERAIIESHVTIGYEMLKDLPFVREALPAIRGHHERWDGRGYP